MVLLPLQTEVEPVIVGVPGVGFCVTAIVLLIAEVHPLTVFLILRE